MRNLGGNYAVIFEGKKTWKIPTCGSGKKLHPPFFREEKNSFPFHLETMNMNNRLDFKKL